MPVSGRAYEKTTRALRVYTHAALQIFENKKKSYYLPTKRPLILHRIEEGATLRSAQPILHSHFIAHEDQKRKWHSIVL